MMLMGKGWINSFQHLATLRQSPAWKSPAAARFLPANALVGEVPKFLSEKFSQAGQAGCGFLQPQECLPLACGIVPTAAPFRQHQPLPGAAAALLVGFPR